MVASVADPISRVVLSYPVCGGLADGFEGFAGAGLGRTQLGSELAEGRFNKVEIGRVGRQVAQAGAAGFH